MRFLPILLLLSLKERIGDLVLFLEQRETCLLFFFLQFGAIGLGDSQDKKSRDASYASVSFRLMARNDFSTSYPILPMFSCLVHSVRRSYPEVYSKVPVKHTVGYTVNGLATEVRLFFEVSNTITLVCHALNFYFYPYYYFLQLLKHAYRVHNL
jgi:hypothetical protein